MGANIVKYDLNSWRILTMCYSRVPKMDPKLRVWDAPIITPHRANIGIRAAALFCSSRNSPRGPLVAFGGNQPDMVHQLDDPCDRGQRAPGLSRRDALA